jgi:hypothetical protein
MLFMSGPSYPAAAILARRVDELIAGSSVAFKLPNAAPKPEVAVVEEIVTAAFWSSLLREEGRGPQISLAYLPPEHCSAPLTFAQRLPLQADVLAHLSPAVTRPGIHLGVWWYDGQPQVWGTTRALPAWCFVVEVIRPGLLVLKYRRTDPSMKFANVAVLEGADIKFIEQRDTDLTAELPALSSLLAFYSSAGRREADTVLVRLAVSMRAHERGGSLLVVPQGSEKWRESIVQPFRYAAQPPYSELGNLLRDCDMKHSPAALPELRAAVDALAGLTAVDGATVIDDQCDLLAFGVKIAKLPKQPRVERVLVTEPVEGSPETEADPGQIGGTRHLSAAQFVHDQHDAIALVASVDDRFTVFAWSETHSMVHAHRLEALLM